MKMTKTQKHNLLEFMNRTTLSGKESITHVNLLHAIASAEEIDETNSQDGELKEK